MSLKGFKRPDGSRERLYTDHSLSETNSPADAAAVYNKINAEHTYAKGIDTRLTALENGSSGAISEATEAWLDEHVTPVGSAIMLDTGLNVSGAAADSKKVGDVINELKSATLTLNVGGKEFVYDHENSLYIYINKEATSGIADADNTAY